MNKLAQKILFVLLSTYAGQLFASVDMTCFYTAANYSGVNSDVLVAIAKVESGFNENAVHKNRDGTVDIGIMQINSIHLHLLAEAGINKNDLFNPCLNIHVGAQILKKCIEKYGNTWRAVAAYNPGDPTYPHKVFRAMSSIKKRLSFQKESVSLAIKG